MTSNGGESRSRPDGTLWAFETVPNLLLRLHKVFQGCVTGIPNVGCHLLLSPMIYIAGLSLNSGRSSACGCFVVGLPALLKVGTQSVSIV